MRFHPATCLFAPVLALALAGCQRDEARAYTVPKDEKATAATAANSARAAPAAAEQAREPRTPPWKVPAGWEEKPAAGGMRIASYGVTTADGRSADISVIPLAGAAGGALENVNRWRGQIGLEALSAEQLDAATQTVKIGARSAALYDMAGDKPVLDGKFKARTITAVLPAGDMTVFFKMTGEDALVAGQKPKFLEWLASVNTEGEGETASPSATAAAPKPSTAPPPDMRGPVAPPPTTGQPRWEVPAGWKTVTGNSMRLASFELPAVSGGAPGDLSVTALGPAAGGTLANVNRWRGQIGLGPFSEAELAAQTSVVELAGGDKATVTDLKVEGAGAGKRILGAIVPRADRTWFFKLTADDALVTREKENFLKFVKSVKF